MAGSRERGFDTAGLGAHPVPRPAPSVGSRPVARTMRTSMQRILCGLGCGKALIRVLIGDAVRRCDLEPVERHQIQVRSRFAPFDVFDGYNRIEQAEDAGRLECGLHGGLRSPETTAIGTDP